MGRITSGVHPGTLVRQTIGFVRHQLPCWRDDPDRRPEESEEQLNAQLCKFLNTRARHEFPMAHFHHEEHQNARRRVDVSALPAEPIWVGTRRHSIYDPFLVFEGKRLPAPSSDREREYVTGLERRSGGIQRFKLGLHGADLEAAGMIGYVQQGTVLAWHEIINQWIADLAARPKSDVCSWSATDQLQQLRQDTRRAVAACQSSHARPDLAHGKAIVLHHLWVAMNVKNRNGW
ncbi:MAG: hypothetical protein FJ279_12685 [Planctomycetes bacterium]|nr:hypothetical protein [Planctomycetota bacterium]